MTKGIVTVVGLRTATPEEITNLINWYKAMGLYPQHKKLTSDGEPLPYNGILLVYKQPN